MLEDGIYLIKYTKLNGTPKSLLCTLRWDLLPNFNAYEYYDEYYGMMNPSIPEFEMEEHADGDDDILAVWNLEASRWIILKVSSVKQMDRESA